MPIEINVPVQKKTSEPNIPSGLFLDFEIKIKGLQASFRPIYYANGQAWNNGAENIPPETLPDDLPSWRNIPITRQQYASSPDVLGFVHNHFKSLLESIPWIGSGNALIVNFPE